MTSRFANYARLFFAPVAWLLNTQLGQVLPPADCAIAVNVTAAVSFGCAVVALASAVIAQGRRGVETSRLSLFIASLSVLIALIFAFALLLQGTASLLLSPCAR
ncbi:Hypothetical protein AT6N2_L1262 [Agrobacterium tumefaciens]|nr:Hypothetical protein AT6N2_L1262 [Agrobacterium tumefaciens]